MEKSAKIIQTTLDEGWRWSNDLMLIRKLDKLQALANDLSKQLEEIKPVLLSLKDPAYLDDFGYALQISHEASKQIEDFKSALRDYALEIGKPFSEEKINNGFISGKLDIPVEDKVVEIIFYDTMYVKKEKYHEFYQLVRKYNIPLGEVTIPSLYLPTLSVKRGNPSREPFLNELLTEGIATKERKVALKISQDNNPNKDVFKSEKR